jgi:hypothetical protein
MSELKLDIEQALLFLDILDPGGRHTIASESPFGGKDSGPRWEGGCTYEPHFRNFLIEDIKDRQARQSNVYYSVNRPCSATERQGSGGKNNIDDIIAVRALAFDIDFTIAKTNELIDELLKFIDNMSIKPSLLISTGGGFHLIYLLSNVVKIKTHRKSVLSDEQKKFNKDVIHIRNIYSQLAHDFEVMLRSEVPKELPIKIDNMSNLDRVMRLPGTVNYPKLEKQAKGQIPALAKILVNYNHKVDMFWLRNQVPMQASIITEKSHKKPFIPKANDPWTPYEKAKACIDFVRDNGLADSNETYTIYVMLPLIGAVHDDNKHNQITIEEAEELFLEAVSGGERYNTMGRGEGYFRRQWRSHRPEVRRNGTKSIGGLVWFCQEHGMKLPWVNQVFWNFNEQHKELSEKRDTIPDDVVALLKKN